MDTFNEIKHKVNTRLDKYEKLRELETSTGVDKFFLFTAFIVAFGMVLFVLGGAKLLVDLVGFVYPAYMSFKAINSPQPDDDTQWLTYWVVYAAFNLTEQFTDIFLSWIPFYFFLKLGFLIWCYYPGTLGANIIYQKFIRPYLCQNMSKFDAVMKKGENLADQAAKEVGKKLQ